MNLGSSTAAPIMYPADRCLQDPRPTAALQHHCTVTTRSAVIPPPCKMKWWAECTHGVTSSQLKLSSLRHVTCVPPAVASRSRGTAQIIAFLDTGAGKTLISVLLIRHVAPLLRKCAAAAAPAESDGGCARARVLAPLEQRKSKLAFFLAPTVSLVKQVARRTTCHRAAVALLRAHQGACVAMTAPDAFHKIVVAHAFVHFCQRHAAHRIRAPPRSKRR